MTISDVPGPGGHRKLQTPLKDCTDKTPEVIYLHPSFVRCPWSSRGIQGMWYRPTDSRADDKLFILPRDMAVCREEKFSCTNLSKNMGFAVRTALVVSGKHDGISPSLPHLFVMKVFPSLLHNKVLVEWVTKSVFS